MKVLILGANGIAGHTITQYFQKSGHYVMGFSQVEIDFCESIVGDIRDFSFVEKHVKKNNYDAVINAIGILNQRAESNKSNAVMLNS